MITALVVCAGRGERFGKTLPKQFCLLAGKPLYIHTLLAFERSHLVDWMVLAGPKDLLKRIQEEIKIYGIKKVYRVVAGGENRQTSVYQALLEAPEETEVFLVHDGVRPLISEDLIVRIVEEVKEKKVVIPVWPATDALVKGTDGKVLTYLDRTNVLRVQTPQAIQSSIFREALERAQREKIFFPDEGSLMLHYGYEVHYLIGSPFNLKITYPEDLELAETLIRGKMHS